jgi:uncharacterized protein (TIGR02270 family)
MAPRPPDVRWDIFEEHLDDGAFLLAQRAFSLRAPDHSLADVRDGAEARLRAHVDGLVLGGAVVGEHLLLPAIEAEETPMVAAAALTLLASEHGDFSGALVGKLAAALPEQREGMVTAFELGGRRDAVYSFAPLLTAAEPGVVATAVRILTRLGIPLGASLRALLASEAPEVVVAALEAAAAANVQDQSDWITYRMQSTDPVVRDAAISAGLALGMRAGLDYSRHLAHSLDPTASGALLPLGLSGSAQDVELLAEAARKVPGLRSSALFALGFSGRAAAADVCCELLGDEELAPVAAEAFSAITGLAIAGPYQAGAKPEPEEPVPLEEDDLDAPVGLAPEDFLPVPESAAVQAW